MTVKRAIFVALGLLATLALVVGGRAVAWAEGDTTAPVLVAASFSPTSIDTGDAGQTVRLTLRASDDLSGVLNIRAEFRSPSGRQAVSTSRTGPALLDGTHTLDFAFPPHREPGIWRLHHIYLQDTVGNARNLCSGTLRSAGFPTELTVRTPAAPRPTTATLAIDKASTWQPYDPVTLTCTVSAGSFAPTGTARFLDGTTLLGTAPVNDGAPAVMTSYGIGPGLRSFTCEFLGTALYQNSTSAAVTSGYDPMAGDRQTVTAEIPEGTLTITTPYTPTSPLSLGTALLDPADSTFSASAPFGTQEAGFITITDSRAGNLGFSTSLNASPFSNGTDTFPGKHAGLTSVTALQITGNAMQAADVVTTDTTPDAPGLGTNSVFATYPSGRSTGSVHLTAMFGVDGVPTSITPGTYTSTLTFTAD